MSLSGSGGGVTPLGGNPIQLENPIAGAHGLSGVTTAGLPGAVPTSPMPLQQLNATTPLTGQAPPNSSLAQVRIHPPADLMVRLVPVLGSGIRGTRDAGQAMQAARSGVPASPDAGAGYPGQSLQQASQVLNLVKRLAGGG